MKQTLNMINKTIVKRSENLSTADETRQLLSEITDKRTFWTREQQSTGNTVLVDFNIVNPLQPHYAQDDI